MITKYTKYNEAVKNLKISNAVKQAQQYIRDVEAVFINWLQGLGEIPQLNPSSHIVFGGDIRITIIKKRSRLYLTIETRNNKANEDIKDLLEFLNIKYDKKEKWTYLYHLGINIHEVDIVKLIKDYLNTDEFQLKRNVRTYNL